MYKRLLLAAFVVCTICLSMQTPLWASPTGDLVDAYGKALTIETKWYDILDRISDAFAAFSNSGQQGMAFVKKLNETNFAFRDMLTGLTKTLKDSTLSSDRKIRAIEIIHSIEAKHDRLIALFKKTLVLISEHIDNIASFKKELNDLTAQTRACSSELALIIKSAVANYSESSVGSNK